LLALAREAKSESPQHLGSILALRVSQEGHCVALIDDLSICCARIGRR
jgi:hypothetical protein